MESCRLPLLTCAVLALLVSCCSATFNQNFQIAYNGEQGGHVIPNDAMNGVQLKMDQTGGASVQSLKSYLHGVFSTSLKLVPGNSAGIVSSTFMSTPDLGQPGSKHSEIDIEFLGNVTGQPYKFHTNLFVDGVGEREQQFLLTFDPSAAFHTYTIIWTTKQITWLIDNSPVRIHRNVNGVPYPSADAMNIYGAIYDASTWATQGGAIPVDFKVAPFYFTMMDFNYQGCDPKVAGVGACTTPSGHFYDAPRYSTLSVSQRNALRKVQASLTYNYCTDTSKNPTPPPECASNTV